MLQQPSQDFTLFIISNDIDISTGVCHGSSSSVANSSSENRKESHSLHRTISKKSHIFWAFYTSVSFLPMRPVCLSQLFMPASVIVACVPSNLPLFMIMCILMGFSVATIFLLPWWVTSQLGHKVLSPFRGPPSDLISIRTVRGAHESFTSPLPDPSRWWIF